MGLDRIKIILEDILMEMEITNHILQQYYEKDDNAIGINPIIQHIRKKRRIKSFDSDYDYEKEYG